MLDVDQDALVPGVHWDIVDGTQGTQTEIVSGIFLALATIHMFVQERNSWSKKACTSGVKEKPVCVTYSGEIVPE